MDTWTSPLIPPLARQLEPELRLRLDDKTKPRGSLGRLEQLALQIGLVQGTAYPRLRHGAVVVFAGDHGLAAEGVSAFPPEVTPQMVRNFLSGGAAINVFARQHGLPVTVVDAGVAVALPAHPNLIDRKVRLGTRNCRLEPALTAEEVHRCLRAGAGIGHSLKEQGADAFLPGEMGIGNSSAAALIVSSLLRLPLAACVGAGTGHDAAGLQRKHGILQEVQALHRDASTPLDVLAAYGGCEIAMMTGAMLAAAESRLVVVVDGFIATAAAVVAARINPAVLDYCVFSHCSAESGHSPVLRTLEVKPLLDLGLRLGEGTGAVLAWPLLVSAIKFLEEMATFSGAGVSEASAPGIPCA